jgi:hypothetical protein
MAAQAIPPYPLCQVYWKFLSNLNLEFGKDSNQSKEPKLRLRGEGESRWIMLKRKDIIADIE